MKKKEDKKGRFIRILTLLSIVSIVLALLAAGSLTVWLAVTVDTEADAALFDASRGSRTTRLYYNAGRGGTVYLAREWESERIFGSESAIWCPYEEMPERLKNAFLAAEDHRFFSHSGVDLIRTAKAVFNQIFHFEAEFGGSSITQQLVKNITGDKERTASRKLREVWRALALERKYSKEEILELYLNIVPMGDHCIGVAAGAERYFGKKPTELTTAECAALAAIINAPARYAPHTHPDANRMRRDLILGEMQKYGMLGMAEYEAAIREDPCIAPRGVTETGSVLSWYTETLIDDVIRDLCERCGYSRVAATRLLYGGGLQIYTLADPEIQATVERVFSSVPLQSGIQYAGAVIDPATGDILGIAGAAGAKGGNRLLNYATAPAAPGSALKPLSVYAPALDAGLIHSATVFDDVPLSFLDETARTWPRNSPDVYQGLCDLGTAIASSKNTVAVRTLRLLGKERSYATLVHGLGLSGLVRGATGANGERLTDLGEAPLALGQLTYGVSVRELTGAYAALAGDGTARKGRTYLAVYDNKGKVLLTNEKQETRVFSPETASIMTKQLERVVKGGTANGVRLPGGIPVAGKTGTTTAGRDKWFVGYSPYYLCGVWCGSTASTVSVAGKPQLAVFNMLMGELHREIAESGHAKTEFPLADGVYECRFCRDGGGLLTIDCLSDPRGDRSTVGWFTAETLPRTACSCHIGVLCGEEGGVVCEMGGNLLSGETDTEGIPLRRVGLIRVTERAFPREVIVGDAQYVYRPLGTVPPSSDSTLPYFYNTLPHGTYVGISKTADGRQFNAAYTRKEAEDPFSMYGLLLGG